MSNINYQFFPRSHGINAEMRKVIDCFVSAENDIRSDRFNLKSNDVLQRLQPHLSSIGYHVEIGKAKNEKIIVPVLFGLNNQVDKCFNADALSTDGKIVLEVEAGRATENNQFLKDIFQACMMYNVEYLILAVRNTYRGHNDFEIIFTFLETLYISNRVHLPLNGILLIGY
ncbi:MAG: hypothetical protein RSA22_05495 [Acinetobacter sp.]